MRGWFFTRKGMAYDYFKQKFKQEREKRRLESYEKEEESDADRVFTIEKYNADFDGIAHKKGKMFLIKGAMEGEEVEIKNTVKDGSVVHAQIRRIITGSDYRTTAPCKERKCFSCPLLHVKYEEQKRLKQKLVKSKLAPFYAGEVKMVGEKQFYYKNRINLAFSLNDGAVVLGYQNPQNYKIEPIKRCMLYQKWHVLAIKIITEWANENGEEVYKPSTQKGVLRFVTVQENNGKIAVNLTVNKPSNFLRELYFALKGGFDGVSLYQTVNSSKACDVQNNKTEHVYGEEFIFAKYDVVSCALSSHAFSRLNDEIIVEQIKEIKGVLNQNGVNSAIFTHAKNGAIACAVAKCGILVRSYETNVDNLAVINASEKANGVSINAEKTDFTKAIKSVVANEKTAIIMDVASSVLGDDACRKIAQKGAKTLVYISSSLENTKKDLITLTSNGYKVSTVTAFDVLPNTRYVESLVCLTKQTN